MIKDPRDPVPDLGLDHDSPTFSALHYALATKVDGIVERQTEIAQSVTNLATEVRSPKPLPWGPLVSIVVGMLAVMGTIGGLVHQSVSDRIQHNTLGITEAEHRISDRIIESEARANKRDDALMPRSEIQSAIAVLQETMRRLEAVQTATSKLEAEINVTRAEFNATITAIRDRQLRNEVFIEEGRKAEPIHNRINQLYDLYKQLNNQITSHTQEQLLQLQQLQQQQRGK